jgi:CO/xanthine dehydrogenase Mo-binding subunit
MADTGTNGNRTEFRVVGKPNISGVLSRAQASGVAKFGSDYVVPNMLHAKFLRCPHANARIKKIDTAKAKTVPGVFEIYTWEDLRSGGGGGGGMMGGGMMGGFGGGGGTISDSADQEGAEVGAIVLAENEDACEEALRQLDIEWEVLPFVVDLKEGRKPDAPVIRPAGSGRGGGGMMGGGMMGGMMGGGSQPKKGNVTVSSQNNSGNVETGFKEADHIIEYDVNTAAFSGHLPNPVGSVAWYENDPQKGNTLHFEGDPWGGGQGLQTCMYVGGRYCDWGSRKSQQITLTLTQKAQRPVRCVNSRYDQYDFNLNQRYVHLKVGFKSNGLITAIDDFSIADGGVQGSTNFGNTMDQTYGPYYTIRCTNIKQTMEVVDSNRGKMYLSGQHNPMSWDSLMMGFYVIAEYLGKDPIDIATLNLHGPTSQADPNRVPAYDGCVAAVKEMMNWKWHKAGTKKLPDGRMHGASFRYNQCPRHSGMTFSPRIELREGVVHLPAKPKIIGHYGYECNMMVVAEELGLNYKDIQLDLDHRYQYTPYGGGADGSTASSWAIKECANLLKKKILDAAIAEATNPPENSKLKAPNPFKGLKPEDLDMQGGNVIVKSNPSKSLPLAQAVQGDVIANVNGIKPPASVWNQQGKALDAMDVATCEVAVDAETGEVDIIRFGVVADPGKILRKTSLESQIDQAMDFTTGCQLQEEFVFDPQTGVRLSTNMFDYKKVGMLDMPRVQTQLLETRCSNACYGGSGISHSLANTHLVIMAIHNAIGKWVESPATPEKVLKALGKA